MSAPDRLSWQDVDRLADQLAEAVQPFRPSLILAVARGGLVPAAMLAHRLGVKRVGSAQLLDGRVVASPIGLGPGARVLVVEDATESGTTLEAVANWAPDWYQVATCALLAQRGGLLPDRYCAVVDEVPVMPWEIAGGSR